MVCSRAVPIDPASPELRVWAWIFVALYALAMLGFGALGLRRVRGSDDFATARGAYGPLFLALAFTATTASGATFLGLPGLAYEMGLSSLWYAFGYPLGVYVGVLICLRVVSQAGNAFGSRSIPEYLGDRYRSDFLRVGMALFSLMLLFYLAGQLVAGLVMFERMLGLSPVWALIITSGVLLLYVALGGAHADILTDGAQGALMLLLAAAIVGMFLTGFGVEGGLAGVVERIGSLDPGTVAVLNPRNELVDSIWDIFAIVAAHIPLGLLPHLGNKLWALRSGSSRRMFIGLSFGFGFLLGAMGLGGILSRAVLGDALLTDGLTTNQAIPELFIALFPAWLAALLGVAILAAIMSTADGLLVSSSQVFANDIYRRTLAPRLHPDADPELVDRRVLAISRWATIGVLLASAGLGWLLLDMNVALLVWIGVGGMMAALAGPLLLGVLWRGVTRAGAIAGFVVGASVFALAKSGVIAAAWFAGTPLEVAAAWLEAQAPNPYSCATLGELASLAATVAVSLVTRSVPEDHLERVFGSAGDEPPV
jgi:Na+/proline symporter